MEKTYIAIDLKSFYASVECVERKIDPLATNLVVADVSRTSKTICCPRLNNGMRNISKKKNMAVCTLYSQYFDSFYVLEYYCFQSRILSRIF